ncbi:hypothetical protein [Pseudocitrobacter vendiensis]|uniref:Lipoprotein n=1 Tax=Pseudocitrobacter vendiensis TaxID=2488306 RepID=A0ABN8T5X1_9ENTR|nr:hypothetical protein [Pseudocitrobacter vendiensis]CAH6635476.1 hypothetical protein FBBNIHIM_01440 [Pseudocitrobacter vendiensis]
MKYLKMLLISLSCLWLTGCGPDPKTYFSENVAMWNSTSSEIENLVTNLSHNDSREDLANSHDYVVRHKKNFQDTLKSWHEIEERKGVPNDARDLQNATYHYLEQVIKTDESLEALTVLAGDKNIKDDVLQTKKEQLTQSFEKISQQADVFSKEQEKFAKANNIKFYSLP